MHILTIYGQHHFFHTVIYPGYFEWPGIDLQKEFLLYSNLLLVPIFSID